ncbi:acetate--CoA ligase family protein [Actinomadura rupiterrae]|uniref:acetate--CoA ligase family protein n=1 Tax=Actinomadura rupiterrae TaxID=559627 RepID=UPI0020A4F279|nr:acetate--CoA ligase family protein [Actinomadura rupiterrae]MCP2339625.1 acyl-CoA synthetase (NDP forming) [Actinomadura rupiterrae]
MSHVPEHQVKAWISGFGVTVPRGATARTPAELEAAAGGLAPPLVVKAYGPDLLHKSDAGAVRLGIGSAALAAAAAAEMQQALTGKGIVPDGFLVEEQAEPGVEVIVGAVRDPAFGPVLMVGLGGVWTEALRDTSLRLAPVTEADAHAMLSELRGSALLDGYRGGPPVDRDALVKVLLAVSDMVTGLGDGFTEFELNPVICGPSGAVAVDARLVGSLEAEAPGEPTAPGVTDFDRLFAPRGVAVVGASTKRPNFGNMFLGFYKAVGYEGRLLAVHPSAAEIDGVPCVPSLAEADVDYALVAVPAKQCADVVRQASGIPFVQVMSGGFREMGEPELETGLALAAREAGVRLLGPNCMGIYSPAGGQTFIGGAPGSSGRIAVVSQSGGLAGEVIKVGERRGLAFSKVATVGNSLDVTPAELLRYLDADDGTSAIGLYLEDPRDGRGLFDALRAARRPVVALVGGRSDQGRTAAASHTGGMIGDDRIWTALGIQTGTALVRSQDDLIGALDALDLHGDRAVRGDGVLVIGPSGGASVLAADVFAGASLDLPQFPDTAVEALRALGLGAGSSLANPLEIPVGPRGNPDLVRNAVAAILEQRAFPDVVAHVNVQSFFTFGDSADPLIAYTRAVGRLQEEAADTRITLVVRNAECAPPGVEDEVRAAAREAGVPVYRSMEAAASAVAAMRRTLDGQS